MRVLVSGSGGLVGKALCAALKAAGHVPVRLVRKDSGHPSDAIFWDPDRAILAPEALAGIDSVVHLAGEPIAAGRWTAARKARISDSRVKGTRLLCERLAGCAKPPAVLVSASALGIYGSRGDEVVTEASATGSGFLAEVCQAWEGATAPAANAGVRVVNLRVGLVLSASGGALPRMLPPFRLGLGGPLGDGRMWMSWIHVDDLVGAIRHCLEGSAIHGPVNGFAPNPVTNREFTRTLARVLHRPAFLPVPSPLLKLVLGEMAEEMLLSSLRGKPERLCETGFSFQFPALETALRDLLA